jgi:hypothetical protein
MPRKHKGIIQKGGNKGKLRKGYKYTGKRTKTGLAIIKKCKQKYKITGGNKQLNIVFWVTSYNRWIRDEYPNGKYVINGYNVNINQIIDMSKIDTADIVIFNIEYINAIKMNKFKNIKKENQIYIMKYSELSSRYNWINLNNKYKYKIDYFISSEKKKSDLQNLHWFSNRYFLTKYIKDCPFNIEMVALSNYNLYDKFFYPPLVKFENKIPKMCVIISNSTLTEGAIERKKWINEFKNYFPCDFYGSLNKNKTFEEHGLPYVANQFDHDGYAVKLAVINKYMFNFDMVNDTFADYISERPYQSLLVGSIPILNCPNSKELMPHNSHINVNDFNNDKKKIAEYLHKLTKNKNLYNKYFKWKSNKDQPNLKKVLKYKPDKFIDNIIDVVYNKKKI